MVSENLNIFIKYNEENKDFPNVHTMAEHIKVTLEKGEFCWGHFTKTKFSRNKTGLWKMRTSILDEQFEKKIITFVFFYSRNSKELYVGKLEGYYDREYPDINPDIKELIPKYYHSRIGKIKKGIEGQMRSYAFVRVSNLKKIDFNDTQYIYNYKGTVDTIGEEKVLECKGMASLLYVNLDENFYNDIKKKVMNVNNLQNDLNNLESSEDKDNQFNIGSLNTGELIPESMKIKRNAAKGNNLDKKSTKRNYDEENKKNGKLGEAGELLVINAEKKRLLKKGRKDLIKDIVHVSKDIGDKAGYDILSFDVDDKGNKIEKYIEVKTTEYGINTPFMIEESEVNFSRINSDKYYLYRVYNYNKKTGDADSYIVKGNIDKKLELSNKTYIAYFKNEN
ncbi:protein of unknown function [Clostridium acidisoli DSM 12555]|uniref:Protein NO VEIN C-terminal domain-containing protein n=1 Tax=Clostridium acidisoli DSM 12555 TaxID=1121291 RepID=A0A1W1X0G9_9CLOT|nr:DUF3883 domain-containing protein [Clostridium acidisoli]SMC17270.1 protein of unknown function [Clostridium acidisoli DSM 12555]